jgi:hypothetical protein
MQSGRNEDSLSSGSNESVVVALHELMAEME